MRSDAKEAMPEAKVRTPAQAPRGHFFLPEEWAKENRIGINAVYEYLRREHDPLPHIKQGRRHLVDDELAVAWFRRNFGVGC